MAETVKKAKSPAKPRKTTAKKAQAPAKTISMPNHTPSQEQIAELARQFWAQRGYTDGHHEEDWFRAELELRARAS